MRLLQPMLGALLFLLPAMIMAQVENFRTEPQFPKQEGKITFTYDAAGTSLEGEETITAQVYTFNKENVQGVQEITLTGKAGKFSGSLQLGESVTAAAFNFAANDKLDNNEQKGYLLQVYDDMQKPLPGANYAYYLIYSSYPSYYLGTERNAKQALHYIEKEYNLYPENRAEVFDEYCAALRKVKKDEAKETILAILEQFRTANDLTEEQYAAMKNLYDQLKEKERSDMIMAKIRNKFPMGNWKRDQQYRALMAEKNAAKREALATAYIKDFKITSPGINQVKWLVADAYAKENNWKKFEAVLEGINMEALSMRYNNLAWNLAEKGENLEMAKKLSREATEWAKNEIEKPTGLKSPLLTAERWKRDREFNYAMLADTYAYILYQLKDYKTAFAFAREAAIDIREGKDAEYNDRYVLLLEKVAPPEQVKKEVEVMVKEGYAGKDSREVLHRNYIKLNGSENGFDAYMAVLDEASLEKLKKDLQKKMISKEAPLFRLVNLEGNEIDIASLKGKVVILDFWATWCGPCKASFPAMQKMVEKYKNNSKVVFLFVDTWETVPEREKVVREFISKNNYTFNVLYDKSIEPGTNNFVVVNQYEVEGIPTKFVVDGNGQIRFKSIGWSGNEHAFIKELSMMIEMAGGPGSGAGGEARKGF